MTTRSEAIEQKLNAIARASLLKLIEQHLVSLTTVMQLVGSHLHESDVMALDDHLAATGRLTKSLGASSLGEL